MKKATYSQYGSPEVLGLRQAPIPTPSPSDILVRVRATTVTPVDTTFRAGNGFARLFTGLRKPKYRTLGTELAGEVVSIGEQVKNYAPGDRVFASPKHGVGAHAQFITLAADGAVAPMPSNMNFEQAATICNGGLTALPFLRDIGKIKSGQRVLINGASGSIGTYAVQLAKHYGAIVTGVCSTGNVDLVKSLGADRVIDYTKLDFTKTGDTYDIIFDTVGKSSYSKSKRALTKSGMYLTTVISFGALLGVLRTKFTRKKAKFTATGLRSARKQAKDMALLTELIEAGVLRTIIDRAYPFEQIAAAHVYVEKGHKIGNVVITIEHEDEQLETILDKAA